jgi:hypothetical protein
MSTLPAMPRVQYDLIRLQGGFDQVTPTLSLPPGFVRRAANFEAAITGGYTRIAGYERFDGRPRPSDALYTVFTCTLTAAVSVGDIITGDTSGETAVVIAVSGSTLIGTKVSGSFTLGEILEVSAAPVGTLVSQLGITADGATAAAYKNLAADEYRSDITAVPGSGPVRGVFLYKGTVYALRDNAGGTAVDMYKSTGSGWSQVALGRELAFTSGGTYEIVEGDTITGATSAATAVITRVVLESGTWGGGDAAGRLIFASQSGTFQSENLNVGANTNVATIAGNSSAITLDDGGRFEIVIGSIGGGVSNYRAYGCDGVNRAWEFDGTVFVPISTGMAVDKPNHIAVHRQHLFLSFGASLQFSGLGLPYQWTPLLGAGEIAMADTITCLIALPGDQTSGALGVYTRRDTAVLYGTSSQDFALSTFNTGTGAVAYSAQTMDQAYVLDDRGVITLGTSLNFGNFTPASLTMNIRPFMQPRINKLAASTVNREKGQYRLFFNDGYGVYLTVLNGRLLGAMPMQFPNTPFCSFEGEDATGTARIFLGGENGFVYELERGTSFDGAPIAANFALPFNAKGSPRILKRYRKASVEVTGDAYAEFQFGYDLGYRTPYIDQDVNSTHASDLRASYWDEFEWDNFVWDGSDVSPSEVEVRGTAENIAVRISTVSDQLEPFTINSIILHYTMRRGLR